jgi:CysZ protein
MNPSARTPGFFDGIRALFGGLGFIVLRPASWPYAIIPVLIALVITGFFGALGIYGATRVAAHLVENVHGALHSVGLWVVTVLLGALAVLVAFLLGVSLAPPLAGPALETLSKQQELTLGGVARDDNLSVASVLRSLRVTLAALVVGLPIILALTALELVFAPAVVVTVPLKFVVSGLLVAWDFLDHPFSLRGMRVRDRLAWMRKNLTGVLGFGLSTAALLLVPGVGLLAIPVGVAAATRLVVQTERTLAPGAGG